MSGSSSLNTPITAKHSITREDAIALTSDGLVGMIQAKTKGLAKVMPLTSKRIAIPVKTKEGIHAILSGTDDNEMLILELRGGDTKGLEVGDILYTSGEGGTYKKGIPVAKVKAIDDSSKRITAVPTVELRDLRYVLIMRPVLEKEENATE